MEGLAITVTIIFSFFTVLFSLLAYKHSKDRFRLDLLEKRWVVYQETLEFCSVVMKHGGIPEHGKDEGRNEEIVNALINAENSFRGIGYHKTRSLFGSDIHERFDELNKAYAWFVTRPKTEGWALKEHDYLMDVYNIIQELPDLFRPYVYFGDYKNRWDDYGLIRQIKEAAQRAINKEMGF